MLGEGRSGGGVCVIIGGKWRREVIVREGNVLGEGVVKEVGEEEDDCEEEDVLGYGEEGDKVVCDVEGDRM